MWIPDLMNRIMQDMGWARLDPNRNMQPKLHPNWASSPILMLLGSYNLRCNNKNCAESNLFYQYWLVVDKNCRGITGM